MATKKKDEPTTPKAEATETAAPAVVVDEPTPAAPDAPSEPNAAEALMETKTIQLPASTVSMFLARVKESWPHSYLQSAGIIFTQKAAVPIRSDDPILAELRANPYLELSEE